MSKLTAKQEKFAKLIALQEYTQHDAYLEAYDVTSTLDNTINKKASEIAHLPIVLARIEHLRERTVSKAVMTLQGRMEKLSEIASGLWTDDSDVIKAIESLSRHDGSLIQRSENKQLTITSDVTVEALLAYLDKYGLSEQLLEAMEHDTENSNSP